MGEVAHPEESDIIITRPYCEMCAIEIHAIYALPLIRYSDVWCSIQQRRLVSPTPPIIFKETAMRIEIAPIDLNPWSRATVESEGGCLIDLFAEFTECNRLEMFVKGFQEMIVARAVRYLLRKGEEHIV